MCNENSGGKYDCWKAILEQLYLYEYIFSSQRLPGLNAIRTMGLRDENIGVLNTTLSTMKLATLSAVRRSRIHMIY